MAAHAAVASLVTTRKSFLYDPLSFKIIQSVEKKLKSLQDILEKLDNTRKSKSRKKINDLDGRITEAIWRFEDLLESHIRDQILPQLESHQYLLRRRRKARYRRKRRDSLSISLHPEHDGHSYVVTVESVESDLIEELKNFPFISIDLQSLQHDADSFILELESMENDYVQELKNLPEEEETIGFGGKKSKMVGLCNYFKVVKDDLIENSGNQVYCLFGMAGIGKTTLAEEIFEDPRIRCHFDHRVWVSVGRKSRTKEYYKRVILSQFDPTDGKEDERDVVEYLKEILEDKKCLVVLDDVWEKEELDLVMSSLPDEKTIVRILLTGRHRLSLTGYSYVVVRFMNEDEGTELLCKRVFGEEGSLPARLEEAARKIAKNCEGLPLLIVAVADRLLSEGDMTEEYWNEVAEKRNSVFVDALDEISKVLFPSYDYLPQKLKMFFLYLGVFPPECDISPSKLTIHIASEGWIYSMNTRETLEGMILEYLDSLCLWYFLLLFKQKSINWHPLCKHNIVKTCRLHCSWRHLCQVEARKNKFYQVLNRCVDASEEVIKGQRGLCLHNNILFAIEDVHDSMKSNCASSVRSLLCFGPYHQYPVPIDVGFKLLRELDALKLRFYVFPTEILELVLLRYLALTCNGEIPRTISKLIKLQAFIVHPHTSITICGAPSYIPIEIWEMRELEHIEIPRRSFQAPYHVHSMWRLKTLLGVNDSISTLLKVREKFREIRKLGIQIELKPYDDDNDILNCFQFILELPNLKTLKYSIVNPHINHQFLAPQIPYSLKVSYSLRKLHLSGMGFPWEFIDAFGLMPNLEVLKLRCYAFRGPKWNVRHTTFQNLRFLLIEDSDLEQWTPGPGCFPRLNHLSMKNCYKLQELHWPSASLSKLIKIEVVYCNPLAVICAKQKQVQASKGHVVELTVTSCYGGRNESLNFAW